MKNVLMNDECRRKLIAGVNLAANVAAITYGPTGRNVICGNHITKDGKTAVSWIREDDPFVMMGVNLIKDIAKRTADVAGDGTTTATLLAREIVNSCTKEDIPELKTGLRLVLDYLKTQRKLITCEEDIQTVASISANGDAHIGELVAKAFTQAGPDGIVTFCEGEDVEDSVVFSDGFRIDNGFSSPGFVNNTQGYCELNDVFVYISDTKLEEVNQIIDIANDCIKKGKSLLLIAPEFDSEIYVFLQSNLELLKSCCVISPAFKKQRNILVQDMRILFGDKSLCEKIIITNKNTTFLCKREGEAINSRVADIRKILSNNALKDLEKDFHKKRLANFTSGIATIYVGGYSQFEIKEKLDRIEDAVRAADCAIKEGVLPGSGTALYDAANNLPSSDSFEKLKNILQFPQEYLNIYHTPQQAMDKIVFEPYLVVKTALENAINIATTIITCDCAILPYTPNYE